MLTQLYIKNLAVIDEIRVDFEAGLNVLTGETGAGKSIIIDAINAVTGNRVSADIIRTGERVAVVEATFRLSPERSASLMGVLSEFGIELRVEEAVLRREIYATGRSRAFIDDQSINLHTVKGISQLLIELHMQGEQQTLSNPRTQLHLLDQYAGCADLRKQVEVAYKERTVLAKEVDDLTHGLRETERERDFILFQLDEIEAANFTDDEDVALLRERTLLLNAEKIVSLSNALQHDLYESDESLLSRLTNLKRVLHELAALDKRLESCLSAFEDARVLLTDVAETLRGADVDEDYSAQKLDNIEERLVVLDRLKRKYGGSSSSVANAKASLKKQLELIDTCGERRALALKELAIIEDRYLSLARQLSKKRIEAALALSKGVTAELPGVALLHGKFTVQVVSTPADGEKTDSGGCADHSSKSWTADGLDRAEFLFTANLGEIERPLSQVASGGELSRLLLTLRSSCRARMPRETSLQQTLIFDEVDAGISGRVAEIVGRKLANLARNQQVLCVTHQPQIARFGDAHYSVRKTNQAGRTHSFVIKLEDQQRVEELAGLIAVDKNAPAARETAQWLLSAASNKAAGKKKAKVG